MSTVEKRFHFRNRAVTRARPHAPMKFMLAVVALLSASVSPRTRSVRNR
jgi:hypothetical protein